MHSNVQTVFYNVTGLFR